MLDLNARVDLDEKKLAAILIEKKLDRPGVIEMHGPAHGESRFEYPLSFKRLQAAIDDRSLANNAHNRDPLALDPLTVLAIVETRQGNRDAALRDLENEVEMQPANAETWLRLADFQLNQLKQPKQALRSLSAALYLDPRDPMTISAYLQVAAQASGKPVAGAAAAAPAAGSTGPPPPAQPPESG